MALNMHASSFKSHTKTKLGIFRGSFKEWFPVFLHNIYVDKIFIYDLFAGSGQDIDGVYGSPLILLEESIGENGVHCKTALKNKKKIIFAYNELYVDKANLLKTNISNFLSECKSKCNVSYCPYDGNCHVEHKPFKEIIKNPRFLNNLKNPHYAKFILMDQYGFKGVNPDVFRILIDAPKTDFIFFVSTSAVKRFIETSAVQNWLPNNDLDPNEDANKFIREIVKEYKKLIPDGKEYYMHHFTLKHGPNYYGLIFGTAHAFGMEKFMKVCWKEDNKSGESNCNVNNDYDEDSLFYDEDNTTKKEFVKKLIIDQIFSGKIVTNIEGLKIALQNGCQPCIFVDVIKSLYAENKIKITEGRFNKQKANIHKITSYKFEVIK